MEISLAVYLFLQSSMEHEIKMNREEANKRNFSMFVAMHKTERTWIPAKI